MKALFWMRRDLRWHDNRALAIATAQCDEVYPVFIFDKNILKHLPKDDHRVDFIFRRLQELKQKHPLHIFYGDPKQLIPQLVEQHQLDAVYTNEDYESYAKERDEAISKKIVLKKYMDHVVFRGDEVKTGSGGAYKVYTPFKRRWLALLEEAPERIAEFKFKKNKLQQLDTEQKIEELSDFGFEPPCEIPQVDTDPLPLLKSYLKKANQYKETRDIPALDSTSRLSVHFRFGTLSVREVCRAVFQLDKLPETWLSQIIWRDFFFSIFVNYPHAETSEFNQTYAQMSWRDDEEQFSAWKQGKTGFPLVDAGMRELNQTGFMHNRVRMIVASFLTKNLLLDWRWGERYFALKLYDFELAVNNGSWQWASSTGCDAQPYFRVFNPESQVKKFDPEGEYIKRWIPELKNVPAKYFYQMAKFDDKKQAECGVVIGKDYPEPLVDLKETRLRAIDHFKYYSGSRN